ncbi:ankyrin repeat protein [Xylaria telfairii]|nr:ankyrin repeat protein [Xylaria telfairii]
MPELDDYTIGWICAVEKEHIAALLFLDEEHGELDSQPRNDNNTYTLGRIGKHNVVVGVLPHWEYGIVSAASVARDMIRTFPNIKVGVMVGIGGGAPGKNDIRLGDVVVSSAGYANGGVFQYDYGKTVQDQAFTYTGFLNKPPTFVTTAVASLKSLYKRKGHQLKEAITNILDQNPRLRDEYQRPPPGTDILYKPNFVHNGEENEDCRTLCGNDVSNLVVRSKRSVHEDDPAIHYGLIASANQLMKDASIRARLSEEKDVLCFEMEAAGLMNQLPFLVVRGICDYSDTHKNLIWQGYAAMTAAAYTRDLLNKIAPDRVQTEKRLGEALSEVRGDVQHVKLGVEHLQKKIYDSHITSWLSAPDPTTNLNSALGHRHPGSGKWVLDHPTYLSWKSGTDSFLWLYGVLGCGKTTLASTIIEDLMMDKDSQHLLYFYFDFNDIRKQNLDMMLRALISQLYTKSPTTRSRLDALYSLCDQGKKQPSPKSLQAAFQDMIRQAGKIWIVIDALDECQSRTQYFAGGLHSWIKSLQESSMGVCLLVTSRPEEDIEAAIRSWALDRNIISIQEDLIQKDINAYVYARVYESGELGQRWRTRPAIQAEIVSAITERANGMFRWASCQLDDLERCIGPGEVRMALANLPKTMGETYSRIIRNIPSEYKRTATRILQFLTFSERPLTIEEAVDAITVDTDSQLFDPEVRIPVPKEISRYCSSLVVVADRKGNQNEPSTVTEIRLAHFSVKEYLVSDNLEPGIAPDFQLSTAKASLSKVCLIYLLSLNHGLSLQSIRELYPMALYSARYWTNHAIAAENADHSITEMVVKFLSCRAAYEICYQLHAPDRPYNQHRPFQIPPVIYYASFTGLHQAVKLLSDNGSDLNAHGGYYGNALQAAAFNGHKDLALTLLDRGLDINSQGGHFGNAIQAASFNGHVELVQALLERGADVNAPTDIGYFGSALQAASLNGHITVVKTLLAHQANVNAQGGQYGNAIQAASLNGHQNVVQLLLDQDIDVNAQSGEYGTALQAASFNGHESIVQTLLSKGADVEVHGGEFGTALQAAAFNGHVKVVETLIGAGADVNAHAGEFGNAIYAASFNGYEKVVQALLVAGADVELRGGEFGTALQVASFNGHKNVVDLLLKSNANVNTQSGHFGNALQAAAFTGYAEIVRILLDASANINALGGELGNAVYAASFSGFEEIVRTLIRRGANVNAPGGHFGYALQAVAFHGYEKILEELITHGADVQARGGHLGTALQAASLNGHKKVVQILLNEGADVHSQAGHFGNALQAASFNGHMEIIQKLLNKGADVNSNCGHFGNALQAASLNGHREVVLTLLDRGADVNAQGGHFGNALRAASRNGHNEVALVLINRGADIAIGERDESG